MLSLTVLLRAAAVLFLFTPLLTRAATFVVTTTADSGAGSLRQAILDANANADKDSIVFDLPGPGPHVIDLASSVSGSFGSISTDIEVLNDRPTDESVTVRRSFEPGTPEFPLLTVAGRDARVVIAGLTLRNGQGPGTSASSGGAINMTGGNLTLRDCVFTENNGSYGGALNVFTCCGWPADVTVIRCQFINNTGRNGGGAILNRTHFAAATIRVEQSVFRGNTAGGDGGVIHNSVNRGGASVDLTDCSLSGNTAAGGGGAIFAYGTGPMARAIVRMTRCTLSGNSAAGAGSRGGGAIRLEHVDTLAELENCTLSGNEAERGGAIDNAFAGRIVLKNVTIAQNHSRSADGGGGISCYTACQLSNSIVAGNTAGSTRRDLSGDFFSQGYNLIGTNGANFVHGQNGDQVGSVAAPLEARLGPLSDNGGLTSTRALLAGSPAINAGNDATAPASDQRKMPRRGTADIGAFEFRLLARAELTRDGQSDIIWQNNATGQRTIWEMTGTQWTGERWLPVIPTEWEIATSGDFDGDGHTDLVWQNTSTGVRGIWLMNGAQWVGERFLPTIPLQWQIVGSGDFNGDGHTDLLWQNNETGERGIWLMNGTQWAGERFLPHVALEWVIVGVDEFTGDGHLDILWQNVVTGQVAIWGMKGTEWVTGHFLATVALQWRIAGSGDFNGDSHADIVWQNTATGQRGIWRMNGTQWIGENFLPTIPLEWQMRNH
jgi:predicted outer membrane repeat protein